MIFNFKMISAKRTISFFCLSLFLIVESPAQQPDTIWTKTFGGTNIDIGHSVQQTFDGGYIITGYTRSFGVVSGRNVWLIKTDAFGNEEWNNTFGGNDDDEGHSVRQTSDGGYIIAGITSSFGAGLKDVYLIKTDSLGNQQWSRTFGGSNDDEGYSVLMTNDGGYITAGVTSSFTSGGRDVFIVKTDAGGNFQWQKNLGGLSSDGAWDINYTSDGGYIIAGWTFSFGPGFLGNAWLVKTDSLGNQQWYSSFGGSDADRAYSVQQTTDGGYILTGYTGSFGAGLYDMLLIKTDNSGNEEWMKTFGGTGRDYGNCVGQTSDGGFIVTGYTLSFGAGGDDLWVVKTDSLGNEVWNETYGGTSSDIGYSVKETTDGGYVITGHTLSFGVGVHDVWLIKIGEVIPVELISFSGKLRGNDVVLSWSTASESNNYGFEIQRKVLLNLTEAEAFWEKIGFVEGKGITTEISNYRFTDNNLSSGKYQYRLKQIDFDGLFEYSNTIEVNAGLPNEFILGQNYPNPFNPSTKIKFTIPSNLFVTLKVYDLLGREVTTLVNEEKKPGVYEIEFSVKGRSPSGGEAIDLAGGVYFYKLRAGNFVRVKKFILLK